MADPFLVGTALAVCSISVEEGCLTGLAFALRWQEGLLG